MVENYKNYLKSKAIKIQEKAKKEERFKTQNKANGITLIALVITIIVLLILAGVTIASLSGQNGILGNASKAKEQTEIGNEKDQVQIASMAALADDLGGEIKKDNLTAELKKQLGAEGEKWSYITPEPSDGYIVKFTESDRSYKVDKNGGISEYTPPTTVPPTTAVEKNTAFMDTTSGNKIAWIPEGFRVSSVTGEKTEQSIDKGLVVIAPDSSEFVWVPVPEVTEMYGTLADGTTKMGKNYSFTSTGSNALNWTESEVTKDGKTVKEMSITATNEDGSYSGYREPDTVSDYDGNSDYLNIIKGILTGSESDYADISSFKATMQRDFNSMIESVGKYGGFYIARYEMSLNSTTNKAEFIKGAASATNANSNSYRWYGLYARAKEYSTSSTQGSMVWGCQYDAMLKWMQTNSVDVTSTEPVTGAIKNPDRTTGTKEEDKILNIYDILGNSYEWTLEAYDTNYRAGRGGDFLYSHSPSDRHNYNASYSYGYHSTRSSLFIR